MSVIAGDQIDALPDDFGDKHAVFDLADQRVARHLARRHREVARRDAAATRGMAGGLEPQLARRSEEHTSELQSLMRNSYAVFCLKKKKTRRLIKNSTR